MRYADDLTLTTSIRSSLTPNPGLIYLRLVILHMKYDKLTKPSIRSHPEFSEWRGQERIAEDPSILGLGDPDGSRL